VHSKKDFFVLLLTWVFTITYETSTGLAVGIGASIFVLLFETGFSAFGSPSSITFNEQPPLDVLPKALSHEADEAGRQRVKYVRINSSLSFFTVVRVRDYLLQIYLAEKDSIDVVVLDFISVYNIDLTALKTLDEITKLFNEANITIFAFGVCPIVKQMMEKYQLKIHIYEDPSAAAEKKGDEFNVHSYASLNVMVTKVSIAAYKYRLEHPKEKEINDDATEEGGVELQQKAANNGNYTTVASGTVSV